jgi:hypothetical protein
MPKLLIEALEIAKEHRTSHFSPKGFLIYLLFKAKALKNPTIVEMLDRFSFLLE